MKLSVLWLQKNKPCATYLTEFQKLAAQVDLGEAAVRSLNSPGAESDLVIFNGQATLVVVQEMELYSTVSPNIYCPIALSNTKVQHESL